MVLDEVESHGDIKHRGRHDIGVSEVGRGSVGMTKGFGMRLGVGKVLLSSGEVVSMVSGSGSQRGWHHLSEAVKNHGT